jgi:hypothetical protein
VTNVSWFRALFANFWDQTLLLATALLLCISLLLSFWMADEYKINTVWVFFAWNTVIYVPFLARKLHKQLKNRRLLAFIILWAIAHGAIMIALMRFVPLVFWPLILLIEGTAGFQVAYQLFGVVPDNSKN